MRDDLILLALDAARKAYGDLEVPSYHFVLERSAARPYAGVKLSLEAAGFDLEDLSDFNYDVAEFLVLRKRGGSVSAMLSLVGPFALLLGESAPELRALAHDVFLRAHLTVLDHQARERQVHFAGRAATLYDVLFSFVDLDYRPAAAGIAPG